jgi:hypothetical protein
MRAANKAIKRVQHPIPTVKDVLLELNGAKFFTKLDLTQAYHQLELSPSSRQITTFVRHTGIYGFKRLNYGTNSAAEIFQHTFVQHSFRKSFVKSGSTAKFICPAAPTGCRRLKWQHTLWKSSKTNTMGHSHFAGLFKTAGNLTRGSKRDHF